MNQSNGYAIKVVGHFYGQSSQERLERLVGREIDHIVSQDDTSWIVFETGRANLGVLAKIKDDVPSSVQCSTSAVPHQLLVPA